MTRRSQKRPELVGTRRLTDRSLRAAIVHARLTDEPGWTWKATNGFYRQSPLHRRLVEVVAREVQDHVILHQMRQVYPLVRKIAGLEAADALAEAWTMKKRK